MASGARSTQRFSWPAGRSPSATSTIALAIRATQAALGMDAGWTTEVLPLVRGGADEVLEGEALEGVAAESEPTRWRCRGRGGTLGTPGPTSQMNGRTIWSGCTWTGWPSVGCAGVDGIPRSSRVEAGTAFSSVEGHGRGLAVTSSRCCLPVFACVDIPTPLSRRLSRACSRAVSRGLRRRLTAADLAVDI
jgi:hypothetical protein